MSLSRQYPFEALFRSQHYALLDNSCREYLFICEFFVVSGPAAHDLFHAVMGRTLSMTLVSFRLPCFCPLSSELSSSQCGHKCLVPKEMHICLPSALRQ